jgi:predicted Zn-dependent protease
MALASPADLAAAVERAAARLATEPREAERQARALLAAAPRDPRPALILGSALRRQGDIAGALAILVPLARAFPKAAMTQYELGVALAAKGDAPAAQAALRQATRLGPDNAEAWRALGAPRCASRT